jgi:cytochrome bd-type quinol oxidase subunit 2
MHTLAIAVFCPFADGHVVGISHHPDVTIQNAAAPESTQKLLLLALGAGAVVLLPSLFYLLQIFKRQEQR